MFNSFGVDAQNWNFMYDYYMHIKVIYPIQCILYVNFMIKVTFIPYFWRKINQNCDIQQKCIRFTSNQTKMWQIDIENSLLIFNENILSNSNLIGVWKQMNLQRLSNWNVQYEFQIEYNAIFSTIYTQWNKHVSKLWAANSLEIGWSR